MNKVFFCFIFLVISSFGFSQVVVKQENFVIENVSSISIPYIYNYSFGSVISPFTLSRGSYELNFIIYSGGSFTTKMYVGLWDFLTLGITEDVQGLVGSENVSATIPLATLKVSFFYEYNGFSMSIAFDDISYGLATKSSFDDIYFKNMYGIHIPFSIKYKSVFSDADLVFGLKFPFLPIQEANFSNLIIFLASSFDFSEYIRIFFGIDRITFNSETLKRSYIFTEIKFMPVRALGISVLLFYEFVPRFERILRIQYYSSM